MSNAKGVIPTFSRFGKSTDTLVFTVSVKNPFTTGKNLVPVSLVAYIPDDPVIRCVENMVQGDRKFNHAETGTEMAGIGGNNIDDKLPEFPG
jgi:hypothetical protein